MQVAVPSQHCVPFVLQEPGEVMYRFESEASPSISELLNHHFKHQAPITSTSGTLLLRSVTKHDKWLLVRNDVRMDKLVRKGNFSCDVWEATLVQGAKKVTVKACPTQTDSLYNTFEFILNEAEILKSCNHPNIVKLVGVFEQDPAFTVLEFMPSSNFLNILRTNTWNSKKICALCTDACSGMAYLESMNIIHRDLGARSCLVTENSVLKISEFGISCQEDRGTYIVPRGGIQAIKWTAPEVHMSIVDRNQLVQPVGHIHTPVNSSNLTASARSYFCTDVPANSCYSYL